MYFLCMQKCGEIGWNLLKCALKECGVHAASGAATGGVQKLPKISVGGVRHPKKLKGNIRPTG